jgi:hypothetical protein
MTIQVFNPKWYFQSQLGPRSQLIIDELFREYIANENNFHQPEDWNCNVQTSWSTKPDESAPYGEWLDVLRPIFDKFIEEVGSKTDIEILPMNAWVSKYNSGDSQEAHDHCDPTNNLSMVYFHTVNDDDGCAFKFINTEHQLYKSQGLDVLNAPSQQVTVPEVKKGDVIIFPSHYLHLVSPHRGTTTRITISANFNVVPAQQPAQDAGQED